MVEVVPRMGLKIRHVERPATEGNGQAEFALFVGFSVQGKKTETLRLKQRPRHGRERRSLVVAAVKRAKDPMESRNTQRSAGARTGFVLLQ